MPLPDVSYCLRRFLGACALFFCIGAQAQVAPLPAAEALQVLARHPQWLRLLHVGKDGRSEIHSTEFFLSGDGATDPQAELQATLQALLAPEGADADSHARCRFPARALWLAQQGALRAHALPHAACPRLAAWARIERMRSVSLLLVSGYFGNPASSFGHSLLRLNTEDGSASDGLVDLGVNFGALVPDGESTLVYVVKGLSGGYQAGFSDKPYYSHDLIYSRTEFRDMWDHELELDEGERLMLVYHLWEIVGKKFTYYFLKENCAYRMAELLALVRNDDLLERSGLWFAPVEMFHRLQESEGRSGRRWFRAIRFIPSAERVLRHEFGALDEEQARVANALIEHGAAEPKNELRTLASAQQIGVLDTLMAYYTYRMAAEEPHVAAGTRQAKDGVVRTRLQLPPSPPSGAAIPPERSPAEGTPPMLAGIGVGHDARGGDFVRLHWAPFSYELSGHNTLAGGELVVLDTVVDVGRSGHVTLDTLDVIRVKKFNATATRIAGESWLSWQVRLGARREYVGGEQRVRVGGNFGGGYAAQWSDTLTVYAIVDGVALGNPASVGIEPQVGLVAHGDRWKLWLETGSRYESAARHWTPRHHAEVTGRISANSAVRLELSYDGAARSALSLIRYW
ncbi:MAG TPA: DUF4105 domain-containing protein [Burkholderiaceae bacterium]